MKRVLFLSTILPEASASAAGVRTLEMIKSLVKCPNRTVFYGFPLKKQDISKQVIINDLENLGVRLVDVRPNRSELLRGVLEKTKPDVTIFDRYHAEEMFGHHVKDMFPRCLRVVDTQDWHSLRQGRQDTILKSRRSIQDSISYVPDMENDMFLRELASIYRSDLTIFCSQVERDLLVNQFKVPETKLAVATMLGLGDENIDQHLGYEKSKNLMMLGNFRHPPNNDCIIYTATEIWPAVRSKLGRDVEMHCYGAYTSKMAQRLHHPGVGFHVKGYLKNLNSLSKYRLLCAPLRFGAGVKGKIIEAWKRGLPVVSTPIGFEGIDLNNMNSMNLTTTQEIIDYTVDVYKSELKWTASQKIGYEMLKQPSLQLKNSHDNFESLLEERTQELVNNGRDDDILTRILYSQQCRGNRYMSKWIELKESLLGKD